MLDLALDSDFSVFLNGRNEVSTVEGRDAFEQSIRVMLTDYLYRSVLGETDDEIIRQKIHLQISRVARQHDRIDSIKRVEINRSESNPGTFEVSINYQSDAVFNFEVSE